MAAEERFIDADVLDGDRAVPGARAREHGRPAGTGSGEAKGSSRPECRDNRRVGRSRPGVAAPVPAAPLVVSSISRRARAWLV